jgi:hypothetical protein
MYKAATMSGQAQHPVASAASCGMVHIETRHRANQVQSDDPPPARIAPPPASILLPDPDVHGGRITLQPIRIGLIPFNAALVGFVEATRHDLAEKNLLCPPNRLPDVPLDWVRGTLVGMNADYGRSKGARRRRLARARRLNLSRGLRRHEDEPQVRQARKRPADNMRPRSPSSQFLH